ncbi:Lipopolysaccharide export system protein LptA [Halioglobus japonicus]|nr:Lipopolysaccharide export system protein LptA [Halioglobus japonicus]
MHSGTLFRKHSVLLSLLFLVAMQPAFADSIGFTSDDTITITAQRGWEGDEADVIHFSGNFELHAPDWSMAGDTAVVYGTLDNPDKVVVEGRPAIISFLRSEDENATDADGPEEVTGTANVVEYFRDTDTLVMRGGSSLLRKESRLSSEIIEYNVETDRYSASGEGGIDTQFDPDDK